MIEDRSDFGDVDVGSGVRGATHRNRSRKRSLVLDVIPLEMLGTVGDELEEVSGEAELGHCGSYRRRWSEVVAMTSW